MRFLLILKEIPGDKTGNFDKIYELLENKWKIIRWVALGTIIFEVREPPFGVFES